MISGILGAVGLGLLALAVVVFISPIKGTFFKSRITGLVPLGASLVMFFLSGAVVTASFVASSLSGSQSVSASSAEETPLIEASEITAVNINTRTTILSGKGPVAAQQMGKAIAVVADRVRSGETKPTPEVQWAQFKFLFRNEDGNETSIGSLRVPIEKLKTAPVAGSIDFRSFLDLVDHTERGGDFDTVEAFCRGEMQPDKGQKFCALVAAGK